MNNVYKALVILKTFKLLSKCVSVYVHEQAEGCLEDAIRPFLKALLFTASESF